VKPRRRFWPGQDPIGKSFDIRMNRYRDHVEVIGVVGDVRYSSAAEPPRPDVYISYMQAPCQRAEPYRTQGRDG
jgi:hypothetical protein